MTENKIKVYDEEMRREKEEFDKYLKKLQDENRKFNRVAWSMIIFLSVMVILTVTFSWLSHFGIV